MGLYGQIETPGIPRSFINSDFKTSFLQTHVVQAPDKEVLRMEDSISSTKDLPYRSGICIPLDFSIQNSGITTRLNDGTICWRLKLECLGAQALGLAFSKIELPKEAKLFCYSSNNSSVLGAFTNINKMADGFAIRPIAGQVCILELNVPSEKINEVKLELSELLYIYRNYFDPLEKTVNYGMSGSCEVNVSCQEGVEWQKQKNSVVKILSKIGSSVYYCSGSVVNNTSQNFTPYILSAAHCAEGFGGLLASASDYAKWVFYFNYETISCKSSATSGNEKTMVGAEKVAMADNPADMGSDFLLVRLKIDIPGSYQPFYSGWDASNAISQSGVCIHHPDGDFKKISTYTKPLISGTWESTPNTHWIVNWSKTTNGQGVTEGGSSGSPLYSNDGLVVGTLTGGYSDCNNVSESDYYGKVAYSWLSNGTSAERQLKPWLDPVNLGVLKIPGSFNEIFTAAEFVAVNSVAPIGGYVVFNDLSTGNPNSWHWYFENGTPAEWFDKNPPSVFYNSYGSFDVKLVVSNEFNTDSIVKKDFVKIKSVISPNPSPDGFINILTTSTDKNSIEIEVFNYLGQICASYHMDIQSSNSFSIQLPNSANLYFVRISQGNNVQTHKVIQLKK